MSDTFPPIEWAKALRPGDRVLLGFTRDDLSLKDVAFLREKLREVFPDVEFAIVSGCTALVLDAATT